MRPRLHALLIASVSAASLMGASTPAHAAPAFNCDASALRVQILTAPAIEPVTANRGAATCANVDATPAQLPAGLPLGASVLLAKTSLSGDGQTAGAAGGVANLSIGAATALAPLTSAIMGPINAAVANIAPVPITVPATPGVALLPGVPPVGGTPAVTASVDIRPAVTALLAALPTADLLDLQGAVAFAQAKCVSGQPQLSGSANALGISVLGQKLPIDGVLNQAVNVIGPQSIDPKKLDVSKIVLPPALQGIPLAALQPLISAALSGLPAIPLPASLINVSITPEQQIVADGGLTERALHVNITLAGMNVADLTLGEARVSNQSVKCAAVAGTASAQLALQCTTRKLTLIDVLDRGNHVDLLGAADPKLIGHRVDIIFDATHRRVASPVVGPDGLFHARAPVPPRSLRFNNKARYLARAGQETSLHLKLHRRMIVDGLTSTNGRVRISGHITLPLAAPPAGIMVKQRVSCTRSVTVARVRPDRRGRFTVTLAAPPSGQAAVYRAYSAVRKNTHNPKRFRTFTLPREVAIKR